MWDVVTHRAISTSGNTSPVWFLIRACLPNSVIITFTFEYHCNACKHTSGKNSIRVTELQTRSLLDETFGTPRSLR